MANRYGSRIKAVRKKRGLSLRAVAQAAGMNPSLLSRIESGEVPNPGIATVDRLCRVLGVDIGEIVGPKKGKGTDSGARRSKQ